MPTEFQYNQSTEQAFYFLVSASIADENLEVGDWIAAFDEDGNVAGVTVIYFIDGQAYIAALTIYDMCKAVDRGIKITNIRLLEKVGGKSGQWREQ